VIAKLSILHWHLRTSIARSWEEPRCPSTEEWIQKMWYIYTVKYYSAIKKNEFMNISLSAFWLFEILLLRILS
jgi:hypothetical protein